MARAVLEAAALAEQFGEVQPRVDLSRRRGERFFPPADRAVEVAREVSEIAEIIQRPGARRIELGGAAKRGRRPGEIGGLRPGKAEFLGRVGVLRRARKAVCGLAQTCLVGAGVEVRFP